MMQLLASSEPPAISSLLASSNMQTALAKASPADVIQLSDQAMQLQQVDGLFGNTAQSTPALYTQWGSATAAPTTPLTTDPTLTMLANFYTPSGSAASTTASGSLINLLA